MNHATKRHEFEGEMLTLGEIHARVPAISISTIRNHLAAGRRSRKTMLTFDSAAASRRGANKARAKSPIRRAIRAALQ